MFKKVLSALIVVCALTSVVSFAIAEDTETKVKDAASDAKTNVKKGARKVARKGRKATGNDNVINDGKDKVNDVKDDMKNAGEKAENHK
jgi:hypothetical protein